MSRKNEGVLAPGSGDNGLHDAGPDDGSAEGLEALKRLWAGLMADLGPVILSAYQADPHRFDGDVESDREKTFGLAFGLLLCGGGIVGSVLLGILW